jgi:hypothetical protein
LILPGEEGSDGECDFSKMFEDVGVKAKKPEEPLINASSPPVIVHASNNQDEEEVKNNESLYNVKEEDAFESFSERKTHTNIPTLKNNKNALNQNPNVIPFSERILNGSMKIDAQDINGVAN